MGGRIGQNAEHPDQVLGFELDGLLLTGIGFSVEYPHFREKRKREATVLTLVRLTGPRKNEKIRLEHARVRLGRAKTNHVRFDRERERVVSNYHAEIRAEDGGYVLYDLQSTHGTYVNNERISRRRLQEGDVIGLALQMGGPTLRFSQRAPERLLSELQARQEVSRAPEGTSSLEDSVEAGVPEVAPSTHSAGDPVPAPEFPEREAPEAASAAVHDWAQPELATSWEAPPPPGAEPHDTSAPAGAPADGRGDGAGGPFGVDNVGSVPALSQPSGAAGDVPAYDDEATSDYPPPGMAPKQAPPPASRKDELVAEGKRLLEEATARVTPLLKRVRHGRKASGEPKPGALLDPNAGSISVGTRVGSVARRAGSFVGGVGKKLFSRRRSRPAKAKKVRRRESRRTRASRVPEAAVQGGLGPGPAGRGRTPRLTKPFVLEEAIKEPPRPEWVWMEKHRWFLRFLLLAMALGWWYQDEIMSWFHQYYGEPVPMVQGFPPDGPLADPPGLRNKEFAELTRELFEATRERPDIQRADGNRELRSLRPVLWRAGEDSRLIPVDFLDDVTKAIKEARSHQDFTIVYARSLKRRAKVVAMLEACHLPDLMSFIPWVESGYLPTFEDSETGRVGLWGFDVDTARRHGLTVNKRRDDRLDWKLSTQAACSYLTELVGELRGLSFTLAAAAYEEGPRGIRRMLAQRKAWRRDQVNLRYFYREDYIPPKMFDYLTRVLAVASVVETPEAYHLPPLDQE